MIVRPAASRSDRSVRSWLIFAAVPLSMSNEGLEERDGIEAKTVILDQLAQALRVIAQHDPARITTLGGECSIRVQARRVGGAARGR